MSTSKGLRLIGTIAMAWVLLSGHVAGASEQDDPNIYQYSFKGGVCGPRPIDPFGVVFYGTAAHSLTLAGGQHDRDGEITTHLPSWTRHSWDNTFRQQIVDDGCKTNPPDTDLATADGYANNRGHLRMWTYSQQVNGLLWTLSTPHYEQWDWSCNRGYGSHVVMPDDDKGHSGFDNARYKIANRYRKARKHHRVDREYWGNTYSSQQCNKHIWAASNGNVWFIRVGGNELH